MPDYQNDRNGNGKGKNYECYLNLHVFATCRHESPAELCELQNRIRRVISDLPLDDPEVGFSFSDLRPCEEESESPSLQESFGSAPSEFQAEQCDSRPLSTLFEEPRSSVPECESEGQSS